MKRGSAWFVLFLFFSFVLYFSDTILSFRYLFMRILLKTAGAWNSNLEGRDGKVMLGNASSIAPTGGHGKLTDPNSKNSRVHRKPPQSFVNVNEFLLDSLISFVPPSKDETVVNMPFDSLPLAAIDIDVAASKGKGKAIVTTPEENDFNNQEASASLAKIVFILKLLTMIPLMYSSSVDVLLRKDVEVSGCRAPLQRAPTVYCITGIFLHIVHRFLPYSRSSKKEKKN